MEEAEDESCKVNEQPDRKGDEYCQTYGLDERFNPIYINRRLGKAPRLRMTAVDLSLYPEEEAEANSAKLIQNEIIRERELIQKYYYEQGFLGKFMLCLFDRFIEGTKHTISQVRDLGKGNQAKEDEEILYLPTTLDHDQEVVRKSTRAKVLRNLVVQGTKLLKEVLKLNHYLSPDCDLALKDRLEKESRLVATAKRLMSQRSYAID